MLLLILHVLAGTFTGDRGQLSCDQGTAPLTYGSQQSKQKGFRCSRQLLLVCKHTLLLVSSLGHRLQKSASIKGPNEKQKPLPSAT